MTDKVWLPKGRRTDPPSTKQQKEEVKEPPTKPKYVPKSKDEVGKDLASKADQARVQETIRIKSVGNVEDILFGTEFTFTDTVLGKLVVPSRSELAKWAKGAEPAKATKGSKGVKGAKGAKEADDPAAVYAYALAKIERWAGLVKKTTLPEGAKLVDITTVEGKSPAAKTFKYELTTWKNDQPVTDYWYWTLDVDDACLETQTQPSTAGQLNAPMIRTIITDHIFKIATENIGLEVDQSVRGGGGHISIDSATTFGGSATLFLAFYKVLQESAETWAESIHGNKVKEQYDTVNAPWLKDLKPGSDRSATDGYELFTQTYKTQSAKALRGEISIEKAAQEIVALARKLKNPAATGQPKDRLVNLEANAQHYQAVNVEHIADEDPTRRRLELRDVPAQKDLDELVRQLTFILELIEKSRKTVL